MQMGRSPSVLGNLVFRGKASHTGLRNFEDAVIFVHDVESCLKKLDRGGRDLIARIALQEYTQAEVAVMMGTSVRTIMRRYAETVDQLTEVLLEVDLLRVPRYQA
jgi:DNA-directed RNA polymerase specialized sigma24 family protein